MVPKPHKENFIVKQPQPLSFEAQPWRKPTIEENFVIEQQEQSLSYEETLYTRKAHKIVHHDWSCNQPPIFYKLRGKPPVLISRIPLEKSILSLLTCNIFLGFKEDIRNGQQLLRLNVRIIMSC